MFIEIHIYLFYLSYRCLNLYASQNVLHTFLPRYQFVFVWANTEKQRSLLSNHKECDASSLKWMTTNWLQLWFGFFPSYKKKRQSIKRIFVFPRGKVPDPRQIETDRKMQIKSVYMLCNDMVISTNNFNNSAHKKVNEYCMKFTLIVWNWSTSTEYAESCVVFQFFPTVRKVLIVDKINISLHIVN